MGKSSRARKPDRVRVGFVPQWQGAVQAWATKFILRNVWRVLPYLDEHDLLQEAYLIFRECCDRYPSVVEAPHFMSLFQRVLFSRITKLAQARTRQRTTPFTVLEGTDPEHEGMLEQTLAVEDTGVTAVDRQEDAEATPAPVARILVQLMDEGIPARLRSPSGRRETTREYLARLCGDERYKGSIVELASKHLTGDR